MATSVLLYGCDNWALNTAHTKKIEMAEVKMAPDDQHCCIKHLTYKNLYI
jgi:hypothetical protein